MESFTTIVVKNRLIWSVFGDTFNMKWLAHFHEVHKIKLELLALIRAGHLKL